MIVLWGGNRMIDCVALLSWGDQVVLSVTGPPVEVDLAVPPLLSRIAINIHKNQYVGSQSGFLRILGTPNTDSPNAVVMLAGDHVVLTAQAVNANEIVLHVDLRPIGINIFDDASGLHVGDSTLENNRFEGSSTAIALR